MVICTFLSGISSATSKVTWKHIFSLPEKAPLQAIDFLDEMTGIAVSIQGTILQTFDGGLNWEIKKTGCDEMLNDVKYIDEENVMVVGNNGTLLKSTDGGNTFSAVKHPGKKADLYAVDIHRPSGKSIVCGQNNLIIYSYDWGKNWVLKNIALRKFTGAQLSNENFGLVFGMNTLFTGYLGYTHDGGSNFAFQHLSPVVDNKVMEGEITDAFFFDTNDGYIVGGLPDGRGFITNEVEWQKSGWQAGTFPEVIAAIDFSGIELGVVAGKHGIMAESYNSGITWTIVHQFELAGDGEEITDVELINKTGFAVTNFGKIFKRIFHSAK